jgi:hypothetical protein
MRLAIGLGGAGLAIAMVCGAAIVEAQKGGGCKDVPIRWFIFPVATLDDGSTVPAAIQGDGNWYSGSSGAANAVIHRCGSDPTYDATMAVGKSRRVQFAFGAAVSGSVIQEILPPGTYSNSPFINVRNLLCVGCADPTAPFTTHMSVQLYGIGREDYRLRFMPPVVDAPDRHIDPTIIPEENVPYESSAATVIPQPYNCASGGAVMPSWIVRGVAASADPAIPASAGLQVGTLRRFTRTGTVHAGQYSMPFEMRIEASSCFTY